MRSSNCKNCGKAIIWLKKAGRDDSWNPPLDAESARSGYCVVNDEIHFTYMYSKHDCTIEDIEAYDLVRKLNAQRKLERELEESRSKQPQQYEPAPVGQRTLRPSQRHKQPFEPAPQPGGEPHSKAEPDGGLWPVQEVPENVAPQFQAPPVSRDWTEKPTDPEKLIEWNYTPAISIECPLCGAPEGVRCTSRQARHVKNGEVVYIKAPHRIRHDEALVALHSMTAAAMDNEN